MDDWVQLINGGRFSFSGRHELLGLSARDVANSLAMVNRYRGAAAFPISVAAHSVLVSRIAEDIGGPVAGLYGLAHDAHEIVLSDVPSPVKGLLASKCPGFKAAWARLEEEADSVFWPLLGAKWPMPEIHASTVKFADLTAMATEKRDALVSSFEWSPLPPPSEKYSVRPMGHWSWDSALFLARLEALSRRVFRKAS